MPTDDPQTSRTRLVRLMWPRHLGLDPAIRKYRSKEANTAKILEHATGQRFERGAPGQADWLSGGKSYDDCSPAPGKHFDTQFENWQRSLDKHLALYDVVSVDLRNRDLVTEQIERVANCLNALPLSDRKRLIVIANRDDAEPAAGIEDSTVITVD